MHTKDGPYPESNVGRDMSSTTCLLHNNMPTGGRSVRCDLICVDAFAFVDAVNTSETSTSHTSSWMWIVLPATSATTRVT